MYYSKKYTNKGQRIKRKKSDRFVLSTGKRNSSCYISSLKVPVPGADDKFEATAIFNPHLNTKKDPELQTFTLSRSKDT